jgi:hypothetical protein
VVRLNDKERAEYYERARVYAEDAGILYGARRICRKRGQTGLATALQEEANKINETARRVFDAARNGLRLDKPPWETRR